MGWNPDWEGVGDATGSTYLAALLERTGHDGKTWILESLELANPRRRWSLVGVSGMRRGG